MFFKHAFDFNTILLYHYRDGTTDVTRTIHLGQPTEHERSMFTLVLKGHIDLALAIFPEGLSGDTLLVIMQSPMHVHFQTC